MRRFFIAVSVFAIMAMPHESHAQIQGQGGYGPYNGVLNNYNRQTQPLSPYLNLLRNGNPAVNYFYGVRPGLQSGGNLGQYGPQAGFGNGPRLSYFPNVNTLADYQPEDPKSGMPPSGHGVGFNTTFGAYGASSYGPISGRGGQPATGQRQGFLRR